MKEDKIKLSMDVSLLFAHLLILPIIFDSFFNQYSWYKPFTYGVIGVCSVVVLFLINFLKSHLSSENFRYLCLNFGINLFVAMGLIILKSLGGNRTIGGIILATVCLAAMIYSLILDRKLSKVFVK